MNTLTLQRIKKVKTIAGGWTVDHEVNERISHGWVLLSIHPRGDEHLFVLGWPCDEEPPRTEAEKEYDRIPQL